MRGQLSDHVWQVNLIADMAFMPANPVLTRQVIVNILDNPTKFASAGTKIAAGVDGANMVLLVRADEVGKMAVQGAATQDKVVKPNNICNLLARLRRLPGDHTKAGHHPS